uniref:UBR-type domain-containing protein n=1 Tax=Timema shepardi TaxID=629360 RepID=A0A7R9FVS3_TIMSH|nr:unnamed protein product [Timema shepardi]
MKVKMAESSSSTNSANIEDQETNVVTMIDVLKEEEDMEENAKALLGGFDDKTCSYSKEYVRRQPLYSCLTCKPKENPAATDVSKLAGVCLACSYHCHEGTSDVIAATANSVFLAQNTRNNKDALNELNLYNHNFLGLYCVCERPYPDPEVDVEDEMTQCIVCEDWYHGNSPPHDDFSEMICFRCMERNDFLWHYRGLFVTPLSTESDITPSMAEDIYKTNNVSFLLDEEDSMSAYEERNKDGQFSTSYERGMRALSSLDRVQQVEAIEVLAHSTFDFKFNISLGFNDMKSHLKEYLQKFAENKKVVREEDIREFFLGLEARKKQKLEVNIPHFCR